MLTILPGGAGPEVVCPDKKGHITTIDASQMKIAFIDVYR
jgi:hypothetical protein